MTRLSRFLPPPVLRALPPVGVLAATLWMFHPICRYAFSIIDDGDNIYRNPYLQNIHHQNIGYFWGHAYYLLYMPLTFTLWAFCARVAPLGAAAVVPPGGANISILNPATFHAVSLLFHAANALLAYAIFRRLRLAPWAGAAGALVFAVHPLQIQAVAWITGMNNLSGGFFTLVALYLYLRHAQENSRALFAAATVAFLCALLSKPTSTILPLWAIVLEMILLRRPARRWMHGIAFWCALSLAMVVVTRLASGQASSFESSLWGRPIVAGDALFFYLWKLILPTGLSFDYGRSPDVVLHSWWGCVTPLAPIGLSFLLFRRSPQSTVPSASDLPNVPALPTLAYLRAAALLFVLGLLPTLGFIPYYSQPISTVFDRFAYLAMLGPGLAVAALLSQAPPARRSWTAAAALLLLWYGTCTALQLPVWTNMDTLTASMRTLYPNGSLGYHNQGLILGAQDNLPGALDAFEEEVRLERGRNANGNFYLGVTLCEMGRYADAVPPLKAAFQISTEDENCWYQLWNALAVLQRCDEAAGVAQRRLRFVPTDAKAQLALGKTLFALHKPSEALPHLQAAEHGLPQEGAVPFYLGATYEQMGRTADARAAYRRALALDPGQPEIAEAIARLDHAR